MDRALSLASTPGSNGNEGVLCITQSSSNTGTRPSDYLVSYAWYSFGGTGGWGCCPSAEKQSVYSTTPADWAADIDRRPFNKQTNI